METAIEIGAYTVRHYADGWWVTLTATSEKLRGPLASEYACRAAIARYERLTSALDAPFVRDPEAWQAVAAEGRKYR